MTKSADGLPNRESASPRHFATEVILQDGCGPSTGFATHTPWPWPSEFDPGSSDCLHSCMKSKTRNPCQVSLHQT